MWPRKSKTWHHGLLEGKELEDGAILKVSDISLNVEQVAVELLFNLGKSVTAQGGRSIPSRGFSEHGSCPARVNVCVPAAQEEKAASQRQHV